MAAAAARASWHASGRMGDVHMRDVTRGGSFAGPPGPAGPATAIVDARGVVAGWSRGAERLLGYPRQEAVGRPAAQLLGAQTAAVAQWLSSLGEEWTGRSELRHRDGHLLDAVLRIYPSLDAEGGHQSLVVAAEAGEGDERDALLTEEAFAQCLLPMALYDDRLRAIRTSAGASTELGVPRERLLGRRLTEVLPGPAAERVEEAMRRVLRTGMAEDVELHAAVPGMNTEQFWSVSLSPLRDADGQVRRLQLIAVNATEQHRARDRLLLLNEVGTQVGSTLDVARTAQEMADVAVGRLADFITVDLVDWLFSGEEPPRSAESGVALRRAAQQSVLPGIPESVIKPGAVDRYPESSPPARCLTTGRATLHQVHDAAITEWQYGDPERAAVVRTFGVHSVMVVPLTARGITLGVAVFVRHQHPKPFEHDDLLLAEEIASRAAVSVDNARRYTRERTTALALQRSLLPHRFAGQAAVEVASRYLPARSQAGVGGDWFDVIPLSGARVALVVGDVVGHGLRASATMGRLRTAVRTLADVDLPPDELLVHLDDLVTHLAAEEDTGADPGTEVFTDLIATCLYVVYDPVARRCTAATAGHPPPALVGPDGIAHLIDLPSGPPLGLGGLPFEPTEWSVPEGTLLALYTDGLVEAPDRGLDEGLALLLHSLERHHGELEPTCDALLETLLPKRPVDDIALLLARTRAFDADQVATWDLPSDPAAVAGARARAGRQLAAWGLEDVAFTTELVVSELVTNAIRYGSPPIQLRLIRNKVLICEVADGSSTAPHLRRARSFDEGGRGLLLVAQFTQRWGTRHTPAGKTIWAEITQPDALL